MKRILPIALVLYQSVCAAEPVAVAPNVIGGYTVLTDEYCKTDSKHLQAYATDEKQNVTKACWYPKGDFIYFIPNNGILRRMPADQFELVVPMKKVRQGAKVNV
jgi:hypothetical protein